MIRINNINTICFEASFWPAIVIAFLSIALSLLLFKSHTENIIEKEYSRHELINQLLDKAARSNIIIGNKQALYVTLTDFKKKYHLTDLFVSKNNIEVEKHFIDFIQTQSVKSAWEIPGLSPNMYIIIHSKIDIKTILTPVLTTLGIIFLFIIASFVMFKRTKQKLHSQIVIPLNQTLNCNGNDLKWFDKNTAASEIVDLYNRTNDFIKTLHVQRDAIEKHNIKHAKYKVALQVAHDIRSPVLALETISNLFPGLEGKGKELINSITKRISQIANDILTEHEPSNHLKDSVDNLPILEIIKGIFEEKKTTCLNKKISFELAVENLSKEICANISDNQLNRILSNLIDNSIQAIQNSGFIKLIAKSAVNHTDIDLIDSGSGILSAYLPHVFNEGFSSNKPSGKGLGLSYVRKVIEENGGKIEVISTANKGTIIKLVIKNK